MVQLTTVKTVKKVNSNMDGSKETKDDRVVYSLFRLFVEVYLYEKK